MCIISHLCWSGKNELINCITEFVVSPDTLLRGSLNLSHALFRMTDENEGG